MNDLVKGYECFIFIKKFLKINPGIAGVFINLREKHGYSLPVAALSHIYSFKLKLTFAH